MNIVIVGGGIVGLATALAVKDRQPGARVILLEKESSHGRHQSTHNSGVLHAGLYYRPGSLKAKFAVEGIRRMTRFCEQNAIAHQICGKLVVATTPDEVVRLKLLLERGRANGLRGLEWLTSDALKEIEPHAAGLAAVRVPEEGIVDYAAVCDAMARQFIGSGGTIRTGTRVTRIQRDGKAWMVLTTAGEFRAHHVITCAGLHSDRVAASSGEDREVRIIPFRGEYFKLRKSAEYLVKHLIYPVPDPTFPFLGVHFTRLIHGGVEAGPNAVLAFSREGYSKWRINATDLADSLAYKGLWAFMRNHRNMAWQELRRSFSRKLFCRSLQRLVPAIQESDLTEGGAGVRAQAMRPDGSLVDDFHLIERPGIIHVLNAPSPAATASLAIGAHLADRVLANVSAPADNGSISSLEGQALT